MKTFCCYATVILMLTCGSLAAAQRGKKAAGATPPSASVTKPVTVTLVRWPYT